MENLVYEYESRIRQFVNTQRSQEQLIARLTETELQLGIFIIFSKFWKL
jgi:hypothetical protein